MPNKRDLEQAGANREVDSKSNEEPIDKEVIMKHDVAETLDINQDASMTPDTDINTESEVPDAVPVKKDGEIKDAERFFADDTEKELKRDGDEELPKDTTKDVDNLMSPETDGCRTGIIEENNEADLEGTAKNKPADDRVSHPEDSSINVLKDTGHGAKEDYCEADHASGPADTNTNEKDAPGESARGGEDYSLLDDKGVNTEKNKELLDAAVQPEKAEPKNARNLDQQFQEEHIASKGKEVLSQQADKTVQDKEEDASEEHEKDKLFQVDEGAEGKDDSTDPTISESTTIPGIGKIDKGQLGKRAEIASKQKVENLAGSKGYEQATNPNKPKGNVHNTVNTGRIIANT